MPGVNEQPASSDFVPILAVSGQEDGKFLIDAPFPREVCSLQFRPGG